MGDHGFSDIHEVFRPNMLIKDIPAKFITAGGSAFFYVNHKGMELQRVKDSMGIIAEGQLVDQPRSQINANIVRTVTGPLNQQPPDKRKLFRIVDRKELDWMGADSTAVMALAAVPGIVFSGSIVKAPVTNSGPGSLSSSKPRWKVYSFPPTAVTTATTPTFRTCGQDLSPPGPELKEMADP